LRVDISQLHKYNCDIKTDIGFQKVSDTFEKFEESYELHFSNFTILKVAHNHLFESLNGEWIKAEDLDTQTPILADGGITYLVNRLPLGKERVYDLTVDSEKHQYYLDGVSSHNSGKTLLALSVAMSLVKRKEFSRIVYIRNSIESLDKGEEVGFLSQPLYSKILTPTGWREMGEVKVGDEVTTPDGNIAKIETLSPITDKMSYKIECSDGSVTYASGEHLWEIELNGSILIKTTLEIKKKLETLKYNRVYLPDIETLEFTPQELPISPYFVGYMIGDGVTSGSHTRVAIGDKDKDESLPRLNSILKEFGYVLKKAGRENFIYTITTPDDSKPTNKIRKILSDLNLLKKANEKSIPEIYKFSSVQDRQELLQGLIDTDGYIRKKLSTTNKEYCEVGYITTSEILAKDVKDLVTSLGGKASIYSEDRRGEVNIRGVKTRSNHILYTVYISKIDFVPAKLTRKAKKFIHNIGSPDRKRVVKISEHREEKVRCIGLNNDRHLYITDDYIPTHNSGNSEKFAVYNHPLYDSLDFILREMAKRSNANKRGVNKESESSLQITEQRMEEVITQYGIETMWVGELRGRTIHNAFVIVDEAQNISDKTMKTILTRVADDCKVAVIGSLRQIDNIYLNRHTSSLTRLLSKLDRKFENINVYAVELNKVVRGKITEWAESEIFND
jgi:intein/homing endonuclease